MTEPEGPQSALQSPPTSDARPGRIGITRDADPVGIKRRLVHELAERLNAAGVNRSDAARQLGLSQRRLSNVLYGYVESVSEGQLFEFLARLGYDVTITVGATDAWPVERGRVSIDIIRRSAGR
jgi:predicted XRE-type DNA-binding protein